MASRSLVDDKKIIIMGDFNIHINKMYTSLHAEMGNTLDLVLTESQSPSKF